MSILGPGRTFFLLSSSGFDTFPLTSFNNVFKVTKIIKRTKKTSFDSPQVKLVRQPVRVYLPGEEIPQPGKRKKIKSTIADDEKNIGVSTNPNKTTVSDIFGKLMSEISNNINRKKIALEGTRIIEEALKAGLRPEKLFLLKSIKDVPSTIKSFVDDGNVELIRVGKKQMETWSSVTTPPGIIGIFPKPNSKDLLMTRGNSITHGLKIIPLTLICDNVREPGNLGSLIRSAAGVGCKTILLSTGCTDPWDSKVLRGGSGAHFQIQIHTDIYMSNIGSYIEFQESPFKRSNANDVSEDQKTVKSFKLTGVFLADSNKEDMRCSSSLPVLSYTDVDYTQFDEIFLVVGGETEGLSLTTLQITNSLVSEKVESTEAGAGGGMKKTIARLHIPLQSHIESLNVANAFGIIAFEIRRQFQKLNSTKTF